MQTKILDATCTFGPLTMVPHTVGPDDEKRNEGMKSSLKERKRERKTDHMHKKTLAQSLKCGPREPWF